MVIIILEKISNVGEIRFDTAMLDKSNSANSGKTLREILKNDTTGTSTGWTKTYKDKLKEHGENVD